MNWVFTGRTGHVVDFVLLRLIYIYVDIYVFFVSAGPCQELNGMANPYIIENMYFSITPYYLVNGSYRSGTEDEFNQLNTDDSKDGLRCVFWFT